MEQGAKQIDSGLVVFRSNLIDEAFRHASRVYLSGHLAQPQPMLPHLASTPLEMGISQYDHFTCDKPHRHPKNYEFNFVAAGETHVYDIDAGEVHELPAGSAYILKPGHAYVTKHAAGTRVVFFKAPGGNDKQIVEVSEELLNWMETSI